MTIRAHIDIKENELLKINEFLLEIILKGMTTSRNLLWATDDYADLSERYLGDSP
ncbi:MAG: hypothetical protein K2I95_04790 [Treponemataceae bacterium]|nr:hypothetical protein [Treponemataceae bacterium]